MATLRYTVVFERGDGTRHKLCRLILSGDGSYYLTVPYHRSEKVWLGKRLVNYANPAAVDGLEPVEVALLDDDEHRLKLSHHPDGFVQFSGQGIVSGRDESGAPKGLGLRSFSLARPTGGPACGITVMNPAAFTEAEAPRKGDVVFRENDLFFAPGDTGLCIEVYYFAGMWRRFVYADVDGPVIWLRHPSGALLKLRVCMSPGESWTTGFVGIDAWAAPLRLGDGESGFVMASPTQIHGYNDQGELEAEALYAAYPALTEEIENAVPIVFPTRQDPSYRASGPSPSAEPLTPAPVGTVPVEAEPHAAIDPQRMRAIAAMTNAKSLRDGGHQAGARFLLEQAVAVGDPKSVPLAQYELGNVCRELGDLDAARAAYEAASRSADVEIAPRAAYNLGYLLQRSDPNAAKAAYALTMKLGHPELAPRAAVNLGKLLFESGDNDGARDAFEFAVRSRHPVQHPKALRNLATLFASDGDVAAAAAALDEAIAMGEPDITPSAQIMRADLFMAEGDRASAIHLYEQAERSEHLVSGPQASMRLGAVHEAVGDIEAARAAYERAARTGTTEIRVAADDALKGLTA